LKCLLLKICNYNFKFCNLYTLNKEENRNLPFLEPEPRLETDLDVSASGIVVISSKVNDIVARHHLLCGFLIAGSTEVFNELHQLRMNFLNEIYDVELVNNFLKKM
jgi:hypothetical protein